MPDSVGVILGAVIALIGTILTNNFMMKKTRLQEEKNSERFLEELDAKKELELNTFKHNIIMNNREHIPQAAKDVVLAINELFNCTENLVFNYPGTCHTGKQPSILFKSTIDNLLIGFPDSIEEIKELSNNWVYSNKNFNEVIFENSMFLSNEILDDVWKYEQHCKNIKDYFYGYYSEIIENEKEFNSKKNNYHKQVANYEFMSEVGIESPTDTVLSIYNTIKKSQSILVNKINTYQKQKTGF
ncbi:hypothetical protein FEW53_002384 [Enterococcus faecalis]|nr:hypothetical protein [Enterococcus faecalis]